MTVLNGPFRPYGVHPFAVFDHAFTIGAVGVPGEFMTLNHFFGKFEDGTTFDGTVSSPDCIPVELDYNGTWGFEHMTCVHYCQLKLLGFTSENRALCMFLFINVSTVLSRFYIESSI